MFRLTTSRAVGVPVRTRGTQHTRGTSRKVQPAEATCAGPSWCRRALALLMCSRSARPARFALVGALSGGVQLTLLALLLTHGALPLPANALAMLLSAQVNFALSIVFTWHDRCTGGHRAGQLARHWLAFHGAVTGGALLNEGVFTLSRALLPELAAGAGIGVAALANFISQDRLVFRRAGLRVH